MKPRRQEQGRPGIFFAAPLTLAVLTFALLTGCYSGPVGAPLAAEPQAAPVAPTALIGAWETAPVSVELIRATYVATGGRASEAEAFVAHLRARAAVRFRVEFGHGTWREYERADGRAAVLSWVGTYTFDGLTAHAVDASRGCRVDYSVSVDSGRLQLRVPQAAGERHECPAAELHAARAIHEAAPYGRATPLDPDTARESCLVTRFHPETCIPG